MDSAPAQLPTTRLEGYTVSYTTIQKGGPFYGIKAPLEITAKQLYASRIIHTGEGCRIITPKLRKKCVQFLKTKKKTRHSPQKWASVGVGTAYICSKISVFFYNTEADSRIMYYTVLILYMYYIVLCIMIPCIRVREIPLIREGCLAEDVWLQPFSCILLQTRILEVS